MVNTNHTQFGRDPSISEDVIAPDGNDAESFFEIPYGDKTDDEMEHRYASALWLFELICRPLRLHGIIGDGTYDDAGALYDELIEAYRLASERGKA